VDPRRLAVLNAIGIERWVLRNTEVPTAGPEEAPPVAGAALAPTVADPDPQAPGPVVNSTAQTERQPTRPPVASTEAPAHAVSTDGAASGAASVARFDWEPLMDAVSACRACALHETRTQAVFGVGRRNASLMIIGEAPGAEEDRQGEPFVGRAGQLLNRMLEAIGLHREEVFIANIVKCRPPGNRDPQREEASQCRGYLLRQIELVDPDVILSVGRVSAHNLLGCEDNVGRLRGKVHRLEPGGTPLIVTYHPAYLLRRPEEKAKAWSDLQSVARVLREGVSA
jgi:DNA polymerase